METAELGPAMEASAQRSKIDALEEEVAKLEKSLAELGALLNTPETEDFDKGVPLEAAHQRYRWGDDHVERKDAFDWFWLLGFLAQKAAASAQAGDIPKAKHHIITTAAALRNWFGRISAQ